MKCGALQRAKNRNSAQVECGGHSKTLKGLYPKTVKGGMSKTGFSAEIVWANHDRPPVVVFLPESTVGTNFCKGVSGCSVGMS